MSQNHTITVDQHGALDLRTFQKEPIDYVVNKDDTIESLDTHCSFGRTSGKLAEGSNISSSSKLLGKRSFPTFNDGSSSYASIDSDNVSQTLSNSSSSTNRQSNSIYDFNLLKNRGSSSTLNGSSHDLSIYSRNDASYSMNLDNVSETSNPSQYSKGPSRSIPHGSKLDDIMNTEDATHGNMLQKLGNSSSSSNSPTCFISSSKLIKQIDINDSSHQPSKNPLFALEKVKSQYTCRKKSGKLVESLNKPIYSTNMSNSSTLLGKRKFPTLSDSPSYASVNAYNISNTLNYMNADCVRYPYSNLLQMFGNFPRCSNIPNYFNSNGSELLGKRGSMTMNNSSPIQNHLSALKSFCRREELSSDSTIFPHDVQQGYLNVDVITSLSETF